MSLKERWSRACILAGMAKTQKGAVNIGGILMLGMAMVFLSVGFIMFPIATSATDSILAYAYSGNVAITDATFTGLTAITGIVPLLILLGFIASAVIEGFLGIKMMRESGGAGVKANPGSLMLAGISIVFIALGLIMFPVALDGISSVYHGSGHGISTSYTGLSQILLICPMLILLAYVAATVLAGMFGMRGIGKES
jgi:hypothetical protein